MAILTPIGVVEGVLMPWIGFWVHEPSSQSIGVVGLLVVLAALMWVWLIVLAPIQKTHPIRARRLVRMVVLGLSMALGVFPSFQLFFGVVGA
jgi:hypothetical protein